MTKLEIKKAKNFGFLKEEADFLNSVIEGEDIEDTKTTTITYFQTTNCIGNMYEIVFGGEKKKVTTEGTRADLTGLIKNVFQIKIALTNLAQVAKKFPKEYDKKIKKSMFFIGERFNNLILEETLLKIARACETMSARCMKSYRKNKATSCKKYYSLFRAIEQQAERLEERISDGITAE